MCVLFIGGLNLAALAQTVAPEAHRTPPSSGLALGFGSLVMLQVAMIGGVLTQRAGRRRAERDLVAKEAALAGSHEEIRTLAGRLLKAQEDERARIARELHDDVSQSIAGVCLQIRTLQSQSGVVRDPAVRKALALLHQRVSSVADDIRTLSHDLHPHLLGQVGLAAALAAHCEDVRRRHDLNIHFTATEDLGVVQGPVALCLYRVAQEAIRNSCRHARSRLTTIALGRARGFIVLTVADQGAGFDLEVMRRTGTGLGLVSMHERVQLANGTLTIETARGLGTTIKAQVPGEPVNRPGRGRPVSQRVARAGRHASRA